MRQAGYIVLDIEPSITLLEKANGLYRKDKAGWVTFIKRLKFRTDANNWTTSQETIDALNAYARNPEVILVTGVNPATQRFDLGSIFTQIGDFVGGSSTSTSTTSKPPPASATGVITAIVIAAVAITVAIIIGTRLAK